MIHVLLRGRRITAALKIAQAQRDPLAVRLDNDHIQQLDSAWVGVSVGVHSEHVAGVPESDAEEPFVLGGRSGVQLVAADPMDAVVDQFPVDPAEKRVTADRSMVCTSGDSAECKTEGAVFDIELLGLPTHRDGPEREEH